MKVFSVYGNTKSGKTTVIENIIMELRKRRYSVGSIKEIHFESFTMEREGTNTFRHKAAGSQLVTARGLKETGILYPRTLSIPEILRHYDQDYVICEGVTDYNMPRIVTGQSVEELDQRWGTGIFAVSGRIAETLKEHRGIPAINALRECERLVDLIEEKVFSLLPDVDETCCHACGTNCRDFCDGVLNGRFRQEDCVQYEKKVKVSLDGKPMDLVPFVQNVISATVTGLISQLNGYHKNCTISIEIPGDLH